MIPPPITRVPAGQRGWPSPSLMLVSVIGSILRVASERREQSAVALKVRSPPGVSLESRAYQLRPISPVVVWEASPVSSSGPLSAISEEPAVVEVTPPPTTRDPAGQTASPSPSVSKATLKESALMNASPSGAAAAAAGTSRNTAKAFVAAAADLIGPAGPPDLVRGHLDAIVLPLLALDLDEAGEGVLAEDAEDQFRLRRYLDRLAEC